MIVVESRENLSPTNHTPSRQRRLENSAQPQLPPHHVQRGKNEEGSRFGQSAGRADGPLLALGGNLRKPFLGIGPNRQSCLIRSFSRHRFNRLCVSFCDRVKFLSTADRAITWKERPDDFVSTGSASALTVALSFRLPVSPLIVFVTSVDCHPNSGIGPFFLHPIAKATDNMVITQLSSRL